jgi:hypothetical protein
LNPGRCAVLVKSLIERTLRRGMEIPQTDRDENQRDKLQPDPSTGMDTLPART